MDNNRFDAFSRFFLWCSGTDIPTLAACHSIEDSKYKSMGVAIFLTAILALFSGSLAISFFIGDGTYEYKYLIGASLYAMLIFNMDRYFVSSISKSGNNWIDFKNALPRIFIALLFSYVVATPVELKFFAKEIESDGLNKLAITKSAIQQRSIDTLKPYIDKLQQENIQLKNNPATAPVIKEAVEIETKAKAAYDDQKEKELDIIKAKRASVEKERKKALDNINFARTGKGNVNDMPTYERQLKQANDQLAELKKEQNRVESKLAVLKAAWDNARKNLDDQRKDMKSFVEDNISRNVAKIAEINTEIKRLEGEKEKIRKEFNGLSARHEALMQMAWSNTSTFIWWLVLTLLFLAIELGPILYKIIIPKGQYDLKKEIKLLQFQDDFDREKAYIENRAKQAKQVTNEKSTYQPNTGAATTDVKDTSNSQNQNQEVKQYAAPLSPEVEFGRAEIATSDAVTFVDVNWNNTTNGMIFHFFEDGLLDITVKNQIKRVRWDIENGEKSMVKEGAVIKVRGLGTNKDFNASWQVKKLTARELVLNSQQHEEDINFKR